MRIQFLKPMLLKNHIGAVQQFNPGQVADFSDHAGMQLLRWKGPGCVRMADLEKLCIGDRVEAKKVCPLPLQNPYYTPPTNVLGRVIEIDHDRMMVKIESLSSDNFWAPMARVRQI